MSLPVSPCFSVLCFGTKGSFSYFTKEASHFGVGMAAVWRQELVAEGHHQGGFHLSDEVALSFSSSGLPSTGGHAWWCSS